MDFWVQNQNRSSLVPHHPPEVTTIGKILENRENTKPIWQGKGKKDERATRRFPGSLCSGTSRRTVAHADERNKETRGKESVVGRKQG